jgi:hypothetical protein
MKTNTIITVTNNPNHPGVERLTKSAEKFGWELYVIDAQWKGFGTKLIETYNFLINNPQIESFVFVDAHDVVILGSPEEFNFELGFPFASIVVSCEKACWPVAELAVAYPSNDVGEWKYINSGLYYSTSDSFIKLFESSPPSYEDDDQEWFTRSYLRNNYDYHIIRDFNCILFQSYSHIADDDFAYRDGRLINLKTNTAPIFIHGNGRTDMTLINQLL